MTASPRFRSVLDSFPAYRPGRTPVSAAGKSHKLSSNESPYGPLPSVLEAIAEAATAVNRYPDNGAGALIEAIADRYGVPTGDVAVGCGSVGVAQQILEAAGEPGAEVVYAWRSFEAYPTLADLAAANSVRVPLRQETHDLPAMAAAITERTRLVFVCNPNNPTGTVVHADVLSGSWTRCRPSAWSCWTRRITSTSVTRRCRTAWTSTGTGRTSRCCGRSPRPTAWPGCGLAS